MIWSRRSCCMKIIGHCWQPEEIRRENCTQQLDNKPKQVGKRTPRGYCNSLRGGLASFLLLIREMDGSPEWYYDIHVMICVFLEVGKDMKTWTKPRIEGWTYNGCHACNVNALIWFNYEIYILWYSMQGLSQWWSSWSILKDLKSLCASVSHQESRFQKSIRSLWLPNNDNYINYIAYDRNLGSLFSSFHGNFRW